MAKSSHNRQRDDTKQNRNPQTLSRRAFIGNVAVGMGGLLYPHLAWPETGPQDVEKKARVVIVRNPAILNRRKINAEVAGKMVHRAVCLVTGKEDQTLAWKSLFSSKEKVAIKVNTRHQPVIGNRELVMAIIDGLKSAGIDENRIIVYDLTDEELEEAGYKLNDSSKGLRCHTSREHREMMAGPVKVRLSRILTDYADAIVNVPAFRHHVLAGVTISMKNHLGSLQNPRDLHRNSCSYVADLNALDPIRKKTRLIIVDAIRGQCNLGPMYVPWFAWEYAALMASTDTVAVDAVAAEEIKAHRHKKGISGPVQPIIKHIPRAAEIGLGIGDLKRINVLRETA
ncbi:DUF362 domain-containing protein [bacterium]|nr:DUF362 domain-containing protein [bacterium]